MRGDLVHHRKKAYKTSEPWPAAVISVLVRDKERPLTPQRIHKPRARQSSRWTDAGRSGIAV